MVKKDNEKAEEISSFNYDEEELRKPDAKYVPEGFDTEEEYLKDMRETYALDLQADDDNRKAALEDKKFVAGEQWDPVVLAQRQGLPCLTINTVPQYTAQLVGDWRTNRNAIKVVPSNGGTKDTADIRSDLIRAIETKCRADRVYDNSFESMVQCGDGAFRIAVQYTNNDVFDQEIAMAPIDDALSVVWDRMSIDPTARDAKHCFVDDLIPLKEYRSEWPGKDPSTLNDKDSRMLRQEGWLEMGTARVTEHWRMIERNKFLAMFEDGTIYELDENDTAKMDEYMQKHGKITKTRLAPIRYAQMHLVTGFAILGGPYEYKLTRLPIIRMSGRVVSVGDRRVRFGLVRFMKDAARLRNFWRSIAAEQLGYAPKAQWLAPESAVEGREDAFRKAHLSRDPLLVYNDDASAMPQRIEPPAMQSALLNEAQVNTQDMKDVTGIHDASLGIKSNETSGRAIMARQREGDVASITFYDNGNAAIMEGGDVTNQLIGQIYDGTRIIRIIGEDEAVKLQSINDPNDPKSANIAIGDYDVTITTGASYTTRRVEAAQAMMDAVQVFPQMMQVAGDLVAKAQDWPGAEELAERLKRTIPPNLLSDKEKEGMDPQDQQNSQAMMQQNQQMQQTIQEGQQEMQKLQQANTALTLKVDIEKKKLEIDEYRAETDRLTAYANIAKTNEDVNLARLEHQAQTAMEAEESERDTNQANQDFALKTHDTLTQHDQGQQSLDMQAKGQDQAQEERNLLTELKVKQLTAKTSGLVSTPPSN